MTQNTSGQNQNMQRDRDCTECGSTESLRKQYGEWWCEEHTDNKHEIEAEHHPTWDDHDCHITIVGFKPCASETGCAGVMDKFYSPSFGDEPGRSFVACRECSHFKHV